MKELHVGKTNSFIGRILRAFGLKRTSMEEACTQDENTSKHTPSHGELFKTHSLSATRITFAEIESRRTQALVQGQRRPFTS